MKKIAFIFPGQGSQFVGMGEDFYNSNHVAKEMFEKASDTLKIDMKDLLFKENSNLEKTQFAQPAILLVSAIAHKLFEDEMNIKPIFALGHSLGEFSANYATKSLSFEDALTLVHNRGKLMQQACEGKDAGMMALIGLSDEVVESICKQAQKDSYEVYPANYNSNGQIVIAGKRSDLKALESTFKENGAKRALLLNMSVASHCPLLESAKEPLREILNQKLNDEFLFDIVSNVTAQKYNTKDDAIKLLSDQLTKPVLYKQSIEKFDNEIELYIEFGANVLKGLNRRNTTKPTLCITDIQTLEKAFEQIQ